MLCPTHLSAGELVPENGREGAGVVARQPRVQPEHLRVNTQALYYRAECWTQAIYYRVQPEHLPSEGEAP